VQKREGFLDINKSGSNSKFGASQSAVSQTTISGTERRQPELNLSCKPERRQPELNLSLTLNDF
jgi:hypothetical protein